MLTFSMLRLMALLYAHYTFVWSPTAASISSRSQAAAIICVIMTSRSALSTSSARLLHQPWIKYAATPALRIDTMTIATFSDQHAILTNSTRTDQGFAVHVNWIPTIAFQARHCSLSGIATLPKSLWSRMSFDRRETVCLID